MRLSPKNRAWVAVLAIVFVIGGIAPLQRVIADEEPDGLQEMTGRRQVELWPPSEDGEKPSKPPSKVDLNGWEYRAVKSSNPRDGVPWTLIAKPIGPNAAELEKGRPEWTSVPLAGDTMVRVSGAMVLKKLDDKNKLPIIRVPKVAWEGWMSSELQGAVGIHFHEYVSDDYARLLITLHKTPPDEPGEKKAAGKTRATDDTKGRKVVSGTRLEATLLTPVVFSLDQAVVVRVDPLEESQTDGRAKHEYGHALASQEVLLSVLRGPQDWNPNTCTGRRSHVAYYYKRELIARNWNGYKQGVGKLATLRTSIVLTPPTRWSVLIPLPPERITQKHIDRFNDMIVNLGATFWQADRAAQDAYHARYGAYE